MPVFAETWPRVRVRWLRVMTPSTFLFLFSFIFIELKAAVMYDDQVQVPGNEGKCHDKEGKIFYEKGEIMKNEGEECFEKRCLGFSEEVGKVRVQILTCPAVEAGIGCTIVQDSGKPYPDCCPKVVSIPSKDPISCNPTKQKE